jgi:hypothetical protein
MVKWRFSSTILDLGIRYRQVMSFTPRRLYCRVKSTRYPFDSIVSCLGFRSLYLSNWKRQIETVNGIWELLQNATELRCARLSWQMSVHTRHSSFNYCFSQKPQEALNLLVTEGRYWALFYVPVVTEGRYWALFYVPLITEERYWALLYVPVVTEKRYWALFYVPLVTEERYWAPFYMPLVTEEHYWTLFYMPLYTFIHNLLNVLVQNANTRKMGLQKKLCFSSSGMAWGFSDRHVLQFTLWSILSHA